MNDVRELIIIGGGPAGYTAALYAARANLEPLVIEGFQWGGQLMITSDVENYPGYPDGVMGPEMMAEFRRQAERFGADFVTDDVTRVDFSEQPFRVWVERDVRRRILQGQGADRRRRRRHGDGRGDVPDALREQSDDRAPARRVPGLADHGRPRPRERQDRLRHERRDRRDPRRGKGRSRTATRHGHRRHLGDEGRRRLRRNR